MNSGTSFQNPPEMRFFWLITSISVIFGYGLGLLGFVLTGDEL